MISDKKVRTVYIFVASMIELIIALPSAVYLNVKSLLFLMVILTSFIAIGAIIYCVLNHGTDAMN